MASGKDSRTGMSKKNGTGNKKPVKKSASGFDSHKHKKRAAPAKNSGGRPQKRPLNQQVKKKKVQSRGETVNYRQSPYAQDSLQWEGTYNYPQKGYNGYNIYDYGSIQSSYGGYDGSVSHTSRNSYGSYGRYDGYGRSYNNNYNKNYSKSYNKNHKNNYHNDYEYQYEPSVSYYAGRGQMSYDDFVRNRELFGGESDRPVHKVRRTGGTVKTTPEQEKNKKNDSKTKRTEASKISKKELKNGRKLSENANKALKNKKRSRSREQMDERARRKRIKRHAGRAPKSMTPRKRKIKRFLTGFSIFAVIAIISVLLSLTVFFKMEKIIVTGETRYSQEEIINLSQIETGENIFLCDKAAASKRIVDGLPYVAEAKVGFVIPNAITIEIIEEVPSYVMGYSDGYYVIGENGRILEKTAENYYDLPIVQGAEITSNQVGEYANFSDKNMTSILAELVRILDAYDFDDITVIDVSDTANIRFVFDDRITVVLGIPEDMSYKIKTAQTIINDKLDPNGTGLIKGRLDVSMCNETKKSYFNENEVYQPVQNSQTATTEAATQENQATEEITEQTGEQTETAEEGGSQEETEAPSSEETSEELTEEQQEEAPSSEQGESSEAGQAEEQTSEQSSEDIQETQAAENSVEDAA